MLKLSAACTSGEPAFSSQELRFKKFVISKIAARIMDFHISAIKTKISIGKIREIYELYML
jgi:hypothetical protein